MLFTVVIPTRRRDDLLAQCLERLGPDQQLGMSLLPYTRAASRPPLPLPSYEVLVTDDGGEHTAEAMLQKDFSWAGWTAGPRRGPAANRNHGARQARGDWIVFTDDDCLPEPGWLQAYADAANLHPDCPVFEGRTLAPRARQRLLETAPINEAGGNWWSCNLAVRRAVFVELNGFDERFPYAAMEDKEFHYRATRAGHTGVFVAGATVYHPWREVTDWVRIFYVARHAELLYVSLHPEDNAAAKLSFWMRIYIPAFLRLPLAFLRYPREMLATQPGYYRLVLQHCYALLTHQGPEFYRRRIERRDARRCETLKP
jgi:GT2 family glycosyltransferase